MIRLTRSLPFNCVSTLVRLCLLFLYSAKGCRSTLKEPYSYGNYYEIILISLFNQLFSQARVRERSLANQKNILHIDNQLPISYMNWSNARAPTNIEVVERLECCKHLQTTSSQLNFEPGKIWELEANDCVFSEHIWTIWTIYLSRSRGERATRNIRTNRF